ncbi:hypothetical protein [Salinisphaera sp. PC39]|uniref:hypothetical protein n=1 Tax=Salinisphaera sp. PC39 TaxID=1304156 RepID=UPI0033415019
MTLPNPFGGDPWARMEVALTESGDGESLHLQGFVDGCLRVPAADAPALPRAGGGGGLVARSRAAASGLARRGFDGLPRRALAPLLDRRVRTWVDVRTSERPLAAGARALMPERLRELYGAELARAPAGLPRVGTWSAALDGPRRGVASLTLLQVDGDALPGGDAARPYALHASVATVVEDGLERPAGGPRN